MTCRETGADSRLDSGLHRPMLNAGAMKFLTCVLLLKGLEVGTVAPEAQDRTCAPVYIFSREEARSSNLFVFNSSADAG